MAACDFVTWQGGRWDPDDYCGDLPDPEWLERGYERCAAHPPGEDE